MCRIIKGILTLLNNNSGAISAMLSFLSISLAAIAIIISILTAKRQTKLNLFDKRYKIFDLFSTLVQKAEMVSHPSLSSKGHNLMWNGFFENDSIFTIGRKVEEYVEREESLKKDDPSYETQKSEIQAQKKRYLDRRSVEANKVFMSHKAVLSMSHLLFEREVYQLIDEFVNIYWDAVLFLGYDAERTIILCNNWYQLCCRIKEEKVLEKMEKVLKI